MQYTVISLGSWKKVGFHTNKPEKSDTNIRVQIFAALGTSIIQLEKSVTYQRAAMSKSRVCKPAFHGLLVIMYVNEQ